MRLQILAPLVALLALGDGACARVQSPEQRIIQLIKAGQPRSEVEKTLSFEKYEFGWVPREHAIHAIKRGIANGLATSEDLTVTVFFDDKEAVTNIATKRVFTGP